MRTGIVRLGRMRIRIRRLRTGDDEGMRLYYNIYKALREEQRKSKTAAGV
jgi:hypothetical protein